MCIQNVNLTFLDKMLNPIYHVHEAELERKKKKKKNKTAFISQPRSRWNSMRHSHVKAVLATLLTNHSRKEFSLRAF